MKSLDATGNVFAVDPAHNMKIRDAESLKALLRNGDELVKIHVDVPTRLNDKQKELLRELAKTFGEDPSQKPDDDSFIKKVFGK